MVKSITHTRFGGFFIPKFRTETLSAKPSVLESMKIRVYWRVVLTKDSWHGTDTNSRRTHAQPEKHQPRPAAQSVGGDHRFIRLGQVFARL